MRILAYIRRSKEADERTVSLEQQQAAIQAYCAAHSMLIGDTITHNGISGGNRERLTEIKDRIKVRRLEGMVAYHLDRVARDTAAQLDLLAWFATNRLQLHTCNQGLIRIEASHEFLTIGMQAMLAEYVRRQASERGRSVSEHKRTHNQRYSRFAPYGYRFEGKSIVIELKETNTLRIIENLTENNKSATHISHVLNIVRRFNRKGTPWSPGSIQRIQRRLLKEVCPRGG